MLRKKPVKINAIKVGATQVNSNIGPSFLSDHFYQRDGVVVLRNVLSKEWIEKIAAGIEKTKENPSKFR